ncbi:hypothetical protein R1flu_001647 [Riccia fluitans]|uniref:DUF676 domain-containing protein n=1 Tax=Riccia fluitans TaxID=41844 RepID=A0ABD1Y6U5_9MARC
MERKLLNDLKFYVYVVKVQCIVAGEDRPLNVLPSMAERIQIRLQPASYRSRPAENEDVAPDHLLVLVHGILASPSDWKYVEAELKPQLGSRYLLFASAVNSYLNTFNGIDTAGKKLAEEVGFVVKRTPSLKKISFLGHSLGGLFARYAIAVLYKSPSGSVSDTENQSLVQELESRIGENDHQVSNQKHTIAGLEPIDFITLATPHLGVRGRQQLPFLLGLPVLEKLAAPLAPFFVGNTGRQLFLTDGKASDPPLLLRMATDCEEGPFISALRAFQLRILYANVSYDHMVGWRTASIRRESELSKPPRKSLQGYKHVVNVLDYPAVVSSNPQFEEGTAKAKEAVQSSPASTKRAAAYHEILEEEMIKGLQQVSWRKVDVSFHAALWPFLAHNYIHVKQEWLHYEGAGVIRHVVDTLLSRDEKPLIRSKI